MIIMSDQSSSAAKSASLDLSPLCKVTWPPCGQPLKRSTTKVKPDEPSVRYGVSICAKLPKQTIFVPGPARVIKVFICLGLRF